MRITQWGEYGVHCLVFIGQRSVSGSPHVNAAEIASSQQIDLLYAQQILQRLRRGGLIDSVRGPQGGYHLTRPPEEITLYEILIASEGETFEIICDTKPIDIDHRCSTTAFCGLRTIWRDLKTHVDGFLKNYTLKTLMEQRATEVEDDAPVQITAGR